MQKIILVLMCMLLLTGCVDNSTHAEVQDQDIRPNLITLKTDENYYYYVVDKNTHVVYLTFSNAHRGGITVYVKADGTPILAEDLGIKVE